MLLTSLRRHTMKKLLILMTLLLGMGSALASSAPKGYVCCNSSDWGTLLWVYDDCCLAGATKLPSGSNSSCAAYFNNCTKGASCSYVTKLKKQACSKIEG